MDMVRIGLAGIVGVLFAVSIKSYKAEYGIYVAVAVCLIILEYITRYFMQILTGIEQIRGYLHENYQFLAAGKLSYLFQTILNLKDYLPMDSSYVETLLKMVGIAYIGEFSSGICKDAGYGGVAGQVEMLGKLYILSVGMPVLLALMENIQAIAK